MIWKLKRKVKKRCLIKKKIVWIWIHKCCWVGMVVVVFQMDMTRLKEKFIGMILTVINLLKFWCLSLVMQVTQMTTMQMLVSVQSCRFILHHLPINLVHLY